MKISFKYEIKEGEKISGKELVDRILKQRNIKDVKEFIDPPSPLKVSITEFEKKFGATFKKVIKILKEIKTKKQMVVVYTDYDADGITGGAILWETLYKLGFSAMPYVPNRKKEGYGFSLQGIDNVIKKFDPALIISVDHGITKVKEIAYARKKGVKIIVTDHHLKGEDLPKADAIFHIPALSGSGVAYFFAKEISKHFKSLTNNFERDYLALASIGTIADLVPLLGPSRSLVKWGLEAFSKTNRPGIKHILKQAGIEGRKITPYEVGFIIAPRINAVGRLSDATDALRLLCTISEKRAYDLAQQIGRINVDRQALVEKSVEEAKQLVKKSKVIILVSEKWHEGIIGLIASKIADSYYRPTIIMTKTDGFYKGSARSIPTFHITDFLKSLREYLVDVGGHKQAAGFTIEKQKLSKFITAVEKRADKIIKDKDLEKVIAADIKIPVSKINLELVRALEKLEPFGVGNPRPTFLSQGKLIEAKSFGKTNNHLKIFIDSLELIAFNQGEKIKELSRGQKIKVVYSLEIDQWNGRERLKGVIKFFSP